MTRLSRQTRAELLNAWEASDEYLAAVDTTGRVPRNWLPTPAERFMHAGAAAAAEFGDDVWAGDLHWHLDHQRSQGMSYDDALTAVEATDPEAWT